MYEYFYLCSPGFSDSSNIYTQAVWLWHSAKKVQVAWVEYAHRSICTPTENIVLANQYAAGYGGLFGKGTINLDI